MHAGQISSNIFSSSIFSNIFQHCQKIGGGRGPPLVTQQQLDLIHKEVGSNNKATYTWLSMSVSGG